MVLMHTWGQNLAYLWQMKPLGIWKLLWQGEWVWSVTSGAGQLYRVSCGQESSGELSDGMGAHIGLGFSFCEMGAAGKGLAAGPRAVGSTPLSFWRFPSRFYRFGLRGRAPGEALWAFSGWWRCPSWKWAVKVLGGVRRDMKAGRFQQAHGAPGPTQGA